MFTLAVFQDAAAASRGVAALIDAGFAPEALTILAKSTPEAADLIRERLGRDAENLDLKIIGPAVGLGPLVPALQGSDRGLQVSGLARSARRAGFQAHDGQIFEALVGRGGVLVAVSSVPRAADALAKLHAYGGGNAAIGAWAGRV